MAKSNEEKKAQWMKYRLVSDEEFEKRQQQRYLAASECRDLKEALEWRHEICLDIGRNIIEIRKEGLEGHRIVELNDGINILYQEKANWERLIADLGGPNDYPSLKDSAFIMDLDVPGPRGRGPGYQYYGAARKLPAEVIRELFGKH